MLFHGLRIYDNILQDVFEQFRFAQADAEHFFFVPIAEEGSPRNEEDPHTDRLPP